MFLLGYLTATYYGYSLWAKGSLHLPMDECGLGVSDRSTYVHPPSIFSRLCAWMLHVSLL